MIGTIKGIEHQMGSGMAVIHIQNDGEEHAKTLYADAGPLFRALRHAFPDGQVIEQMIDYEMDDMGLGMMAGFTPLEN